MRSFRVSSNQTGYPSQYNSLRADARGGSFLLAHQMLGYLELPDAPTNDQTITLTVNGVDIPLTAVGTIGTTSGNILNPGTATGFATNVLALLNQPQTTTANSVALSAADQQYLSYLSFSLVGTTIYISSNNTLLSATLTSLTVSTTVTGASWTAQTMQLYVEPGTVYVNGTRVIFAGGPTPTVTAPSDNPRIDVLTVDSSGTLAWTTGTEASSPTAPTYPADKVALCELYNIVGETALYDYENQQSGQGYISNDVRAFLGLPFNPGAIPDSLVPVADGTLDLGSSSKEWNNGYFKSSIYLNGEPLDAFGIADLLFGNGSDGTVTFDGSTTILGIAPSSEIYTLTRDIFCTDITVNSGVTIKTANYRIYYSGTLTNNGTISNAGQSGSGSTAGTATAAGTLPASTSGTAGVGYSTATSASGITHSLGGSGGNGANGNNTNSGGGSSGSVGSGGSGGTATAPNSKFMLNVAALFMLDLLPTSTSLNGFTGGAGGAGGAGTSNGGSGGGGGAGGGIIYLSGLKTINNGTINANGGAGGNGTNNGNASGGGGGGGGGGAIILITGTHTNNGTEEANGGVGGTTGGYPPLTNGGNGGNGNIYAFVL